MNPERHRGLPHGGRAIPERRARADIDGLALPGRFRDEIRRPPRRGGTGGVVDRMKALVGEGASRDEGGLGSGGGAGRWRSRSPEGAADVHSVGGGRNGTVSLVHNDVSLGDVHLFLCHACTFLVVWWF